MSMINKALSDEFAKQHQREKPQQVMAAVATYFGLTVAQLVGTKRTPLFVRARFLAMFIVRDYCGASYPAIAEIFKRDHTSVMHAIKCVKQALETEVELKADIDAVLARLA